jgi:hypothetical protein
VLDSIDMPTNSRWRFFVYSYLLSELDNHEETGQGGGAYHLEQAFVRLGRP